MTDAELLTYIQHALSTYGDDGGVACYGHVLGANEPPKAGVLKVVLWEDAKFTASNSDISAPPDMEYEITVRRIK